MAIRVGMERVFIFPKVPHTISPLEVLPPSPSHTDKLEPTTGTRKAKHGPPAVGPSLFPISTQRPVLTRLDAINGHLGIHCHRCRQHHEGRSQNQSLRRRGCPGSGRGVDSVPRSDPGTPALGPDHWDPHRGRPQRHLEGEKKCGCL